MDQTQRITNVDQLISHGNIKGRKDMIEILETGLRALTPDQRHAILDRWMPPTVEQATDRRKVAVGWVAAGFAALAVLVAAVAMFRRVRHAHPR